MFFILTGGTIDSYYDTDKCTAIPFNGSIIKNYLEKTVQRDCHKDKFVVNFQRFSTPYPEVA